MKRPAIMFYPGDYLKDPHVSMCSPATRGIWVDLLCAMHENGQTGSIEGTTEQLSRITRCAPEEVEKAITELTATKTADVTKCNGVYQICNRRMVREHKEREGSKLRVDRYRSKRVCNENVTFPSSSSSSFSSSISREDDTLKGVYDKHPLLRQLHAVPMLRGITLEIWLKCVQRRSKYMDLTKAVKFVCDKAELQTDIKNPGTFLDSYLSYYEKDHLTEIKSREAVAVRREQKKKELRAFIDEWLLSEDKQQATEAINHALKLHKDEFGQGFINEVEQMGTAESRSHDCK